MPHIKYKSNFCMAYQYSLLFLVADKCGSHQPLAVALFQLPTSGDSNEPIMAWSNRMYQPGQATQR